VLLVLGAGYVGAALGALALDRGEEVVLADNWYATDRSQLAELAERGARVETADVRHAEDLDRLLAEGPDRVYLLAAQASRPLAESEPDYTEQTNLVGARRVAEALARAGGAPLFYGSSLHVYGPRLEGQVRADHPYGPQGDLSHLSKIYAELCLEMYGRRHGFDVSLLRLGIVYGPSPVEHDRPESQTVVDKFRRLAAAGEELPLDDGGKATIGVVHVADVARILLDGPSAGAHNVAAETVTVADVAALARGDSPAGGANWQVESPFEYERSLAEYMA
jgi:nucleoside-diphosphate-sugar epimerase